MREKLHKLKSLYLKESKHSHYQILSDELTEMIGIGKSQNRTRYEKERLDFILAKLSVSNKTILDIGGNTGYFTTELIRRGAASVHYVEGNKSHAEFTELALEVLGYQGNAIIDSRYYDFAENNPGDFDITLLLNVVHHLGDDYGDSEIGIGKAKSLMLRNINDLSRISKHLILQLGYCWKGDVNLPLFESGTKQDIIDYVAKGVARFWEIEGIGIAEMDNGVICFREPDRMNLERRDDLGEFLNRPIFILKSLKLR